MGVLNRQTHYRSSWYLGRYDWEEVGKAVGMELATYPSSVMIRSDPYRTVCLQNEDRQTRIDSDVITLAGVFWVCRNLDGLIIWCALRKCECWIFHS